MFKYDGPTKIIRRRAVFAALLITASLFREAEPSFLINSPLQNSTSSNFDTNNDSKDVESVEQSSSDTTEGGSENELLHYTNWTEVNEFEGTEERWRQQPRVVDVEYLTTADKLAAVEIQEKMKTFFTSHANLTALQLLLEEYNNETGDKSEVTAKLWQSIVSQRLYTLWNRFDSAVNIDTVIEEIESSVMTSMSCNACEAAAGFLQESVLRGNSKEDIIEAGLAICSQFHFEPLRVCRGVVTNLAGELTMVAQLVLLPPKVICPFLVGPVCGEGEDERLDWGLQIPPWPKPPLKRHQTTEGALTLKVLHLSDTHFDPYYLEGSDADCGEPLCCREGTAGTEEARAGKWGDYRKCDTPLRTIQSMFEDIRARHKDIAYILWTGDLPPHDIWNQTRDSNLLVLRETVQQLVDYFPNTLVFPALGNHESVPVNSYPPPSVPPQHSVQWLYDELDREWLRWLPSHASPTILKGGYYSVQVLPGLRIISINTNYCNHKNVMLVVDSADPTDQLQWLIYELQAAELRNEQVHIIGHIPPGYHDCLRVWSRNFNTIVNRYESTISAQFYGHTHYDEFKLFYERDEANFTRATNVAYIAPSVTTYGGLNPGYRIYHVEATEGSLRRVVDHETWIMNLVEANHPSAAHLNPRWYRLYSARQDYDMEALQPADWNKLIYRMVEDDDLFQRFYSHYWKNASSPSACEGQCKKDLLCDLMSGRSHDRKTTCSLLHESVQALRTTVWSNWFFPGLVVTSLGSLFMLV